MSPRINYLAVGGDVQQLALVLSECLGSLLVTQQSSGDPSVIWRAVATPAEYADVVQCSNCCLVPSGFSGCFEREDCKRGWVLVRNGAPAIAVSPTGMVDGSVRVGRLYLYPSEDDSLRKPFERVQRKVRKLGMRCPNEPRYWALPGARGAADTMIDLLGRHPMGFGLT